MWRGRGRGGRYGGRTSKKNVIQLEGSASSPDSKKKQASQTGEDKRVWSIVREGKALLTPLQSLIIYSFDPATDNYGMRVEKREMSGKVTTLLMKTVNLGGRTDDLYSNLSSVLSEIGTKMPPPNLVVVERQPPTNYWTVRLSQHTIAYYMLMTTATVVEVNPKTCLTILGCPTAQGTRKKWALWYSEQFLTHMVDGVGLAIMSGKLPGGTKGTGGIHRGGVKVDDMAITLCQVEALLQHWKGWFPPKTATPTLPIPTLIPCLSSVTSIPLPAPVQMYQDPSSQWIQGFSSTATIERIPIPTEKASIPSEQESIVIDIPQVRHPQVPLHSYSSQPSQVPYYQQGYNVPIGISVQAIVRY